MPRVVDCSFSCLASACSLAGSYSRGHTKHHKNSRHIVASLRVSMNISAMVRQPGHFVHLHHQILPWEGCGKVS